MKAPSVPSKCERFCVLDAKNRPVEVFDRAEWSRWTAENGALEQHEHIVQKILRTLTGR